MRESALDVNWIVDSRGDAKERRGKGGGSPQEVKENTEETGNEGVEEKGEGRKIERG